MILVQKAQADIEVIASHIREKDKRGASFGMHVTGLQEQMVGEVRRALRTSENKIPKILPPKPGNTTHSRG